MPAYPCTAESLLPYVIHPAQAPCFSVGLGTDGTLARAAVSGAWCTATASVYNVAGDENNVYVHSKQPYTNATASAGGFSWSYGTNGSGYALIYLNGPAPGALITVTVGGGSCTTRD